MHLLRWHPSDGGRGAQVLAAVRGQNDWLLVTATATAAVDRRSVDQCRAGDAPAAAVEPGGGGAGRRCGHGSSSPGLTRSGATSSYSPAATSRRPGATARWSSSTKRSSARRKPRSNGCGRAARRGSGWSSSCRPSSNNRPARWNAGPPTRSGRGSRSSSTSCTTSSGRTASTVAGPTPATGP